MAVALGPIPIFKNWAADVPAFETAKEKLFKIRMIAKLINIICDLVMV
jgi:hypothetical protein